MPKASDYDRANDDLVKKLCAARMSDAEIAERIGFSVRTVVRIRLRLNLYRRDPPAAPVADDTLRALADEGLTWAEIAKRTGLTHRTVQERMSRLKLSAPNFVEGLPAVDPDEPLALPRSIKLDPKRYRRRR